MSDYIFNENELTQSPRNKIKGWADAILGGLAIVAFVSVLIFFAGIIGFSLTLPWSFPALPALLGILVRSPIH